MDFKVEMAYFSDEKPIEYIPVLVYCPQRFKHGFSVCIYDGVSNWYIEGIFGGKLLSFPAYDFDRWAYLPDCDN